MKKNNNFFNSFRSIKWPIAMGRGPSSVNITLRTTTIITNIYQMLCVAPVRKADFN